MALVVIGQLDGRWLDLEYPNGKRVTLESGESVEIGRGELEFNGSYDTGFFVIRRSSKGKIVYTKSIDDKSAWKIGPFYRHRVVEPEDEKDPILKVLRSHSIPVGRFRRIEGKQQVVELSNRDTDTIGDYCHCRVFSDATGHKVIGCEYPCEGIIVSRERFDDAKIIVTAFVLEDVCQLDIYGPDPTDHIWNAEIEKVYVRADAQSEDVARFIEQAMQWANQELGRRIFPV